jgi:hypothetical protein
VLPPEATQRLQDMARPLVVTEPVAAGFVWTHLSVERDHALFLLERAAVGSSGRPAAPGAAPARLWLTHEDARRQPGSRIDSRSFVLYLDGSDADGRRAAQALADRLVAADRSGEFPSVWAAGPPSSRGDVLMTALWSALFVLLAWMAAAALRRRRPPRWRDVLADGWPFAALFAGALVPRLALATWGPGDMWFSLAPAFGAEVPGAEGYGAAPIVLLRAIFAVLGTSFDRAVVVSLTLGSLAPVLLAAAVRALHGDRPLAWAAGALLAAQPMLIRHGGEAGREAWVLALAALSLWLFARGFRQTRLAPAAAIFVAAAQAAFLCAHSRPEAVLVFPVVGALVLLGAVGRPWRPARAAVAFLSLGAAALGWLVTIPAVAQTALHGRELAGTLYWTVGRLGADYNPWLSPELSPAAAIVLAGLGVGFGLAGWPRLAARPDAPAVGAETRRLTLWALAALLAVSVVASQYPTAGPQLANARYHTLAYLPFAALAAVGLRALVVLVGRWRAARLAVAAAAAGAVVVTAIGPARLIDRPYTLDFELRFILENVERLPADAAIFQVRQPEDYALKDPHGYLREIAPGHRRWRFWTGALPDPLPENAVYYHAAGCYNTVAGADVLSACEAGEALFAARPLVEATIPARPLDHRRPFFVPELRIGFYAMQPGLAGP